jgi:hypothetical protein
MVSATWIAPTSGRIVTQIQSDSSPTDSPVRVRYAQPGSRSLGIAISLGGCAFRLAGFELQDNSVRCWFAPHDMPIGAKIIDAIHEGIRLRDKVPPSVGALSQERQGFSSVRGETWQPPFALCESASCGCNARGLSARLAPTSGRIVTQIQSSSARTMPSQAVGLQCVGLCGVPLSFRGPR